MSCREDCKHLKEGSLVKKDTHLAEMEKLHNHNKSVHIPVLKSRPDSIGAFLLRLKNDAERHS